MVSTESRFVYIIALEVADGGNLKVFSDFIGNWSTEGLFGGILVAQRALAGNLNRPNGNGGRTVGDQYLPPVSVD